VHLFISTPDVEAKEARQDLKNNYTSSQSIARKPIVFGNGEFKLSLNVS
jgi:hypothetical protein